MRRCLTFCLVALCVLAAPSAASARPLAPRGIRVQVGPGASLSFGSSWVVCANVAARNPYRFAGITKIPCRGDDPDAIRMHYDASGQPIDLWISHSDDPAITEPALKSAPPEFITAMSNQLCAQARNRAGYDVGRCSWTLSTVAGHTALVWNSTQTSDRDPLKLPYEMRAFSVADKGGYLTVLAMTPVMVRGKTDAVIRGLEESLLIDAGTPDAPLPAEFVKLSPAPGVTVTVPKGWIACDATNDALLGNASDPLNARVQICGGMATSIGFQLRAFNPRPFRTAVFSVRYDHAFRLTEAGIAKLASVPAATLKEQACPAVTAPMVQLHITIEVCEVSVSTFGGRAAVFTDVVGIPPDDIVGRFGLRIIEVAYPQGYLQFQIDAPLSLASVTKPDLDAILNSVTFDDAAAAAAPPPAATDSSPDAPKAPAPPKVPSGAI